MFLPNLFQSSVRREERPVTLNMRKVLFLFVRSFFIFITLDKQRGNRRIHNYSRNNIYTDNKFRKEKKIRLLRVFQTKIVTVCISATDVYQDVLKIPIFELEMNYY